MSLSEPLLSVVARGDRAASLEALRDRLAAVLDGCDSARDVAALSARLVDVLSELADLPARTKGTALDELAQRRASGDGIPARSLRPGGR